MGSAQSMTYTEEPDPLPKQETAKLIELSNVRYTIPWKCDMAVGLVFFNPAKSKRMVMNYFYTIEKLKLAKIPYYTLELVFDKQEPELADAFHVWSKSILFHKENLCTILESKIPWWFSKVLFLDADIIFGNPDWYSEVSGCVEQT
jgi:hypothetical protein